MTGLRAGIVLPIVLVLLAGCQGACPGGSCGEDVYSYSVDVEMVEDPSDNETVLNATDPRIADLAIMNESIAENATERSEIISINETTYNELSQKFADLPLYQNDSHSMSILVRYNGSIYEVRLEKHDLG